MSNGKKHRAGDGSVIRRNHKDGNVSWLLKYDIGRDEHGKRRTRYLIVRGGNEANARRKLREVLSTVDKGIHVDTARTSLGEWITTWLADVAAARVGAKTHERYAQLLELHVKPRLGSTLIQKLQPAAIQALYTELLKSGRRPSRAKVQPEDRETGLSTSTVLAVHRALSMCLRSAVRLRVIPRNPCSDVDPPKKARGASESASVKALDQDQLDALLKALESDELFLLAVALAATGLRRGEAFGLRWSDLDFEQKTLRVYRKVEETKKHGVRVLDRPKTSSSRRTIGIDDGLIAMLRKEWKEQAEIQLKLGRRIERDALIFHPDPTEPTLPWSPDWMSRKFAKHAAARGFDGVGLHDLRHTHATLLLLNGAPLHMVAARLGHSSPTITLTTYAHVLKRGEDQVTALAGALLKGII